jgi:hypothetical protein
VLTDPKNSDRNFLEQLGTLVRDEWEEGNEIYDMRADETMDVMNVKWWAKNLPSLASTAAMFIPGMAAGRAASIAGRLAGRAAGKATKVGKILDKAEDLAHTQKLADMGEAVFRTGGGAVAMRHAENMRSVHDVYEVAYDDVANYAGDLSDFHNTPAWRAAVDELGHQPTREELAAYVAGQSSLQSYKVNSLNIGFDLLQFGALSKALKGTRGVRRGLKGAQQRAAAAGKELTRKQRWVARAKGLSTAAWEAGSEGIEEAVNFIGEAEGKYLGKEITNRGDGSTRAERIKGYTQDDHFWESAFLGAVGGGVMMGGGAALGARKASKNHQAIMDSIEKRKAALAEMGQKVKEAEEKGDVESAAAIRDLMNQQAFDLGRAAAFSNTSDLLDIQLSVFEEALREEGHSESQIEELLSETKEQFTNAEASVVKAKLVAKALKLDEEVGSEVIGNLTQFDFHAKELENAEKLAAERLAGVPTEQVERRKKEIIWHYLNDLINREETKNVDVVVEKLETLAGGPEVLQELSQEVVGSIDEDGTVVDGKPLADVGEGKYDEVIGDTIKTALDKQSLAETRAEFLSDENLEKFAQRVKENKKKKAEERKENRKKATEEAKTEEELKAAKKTAESVEEEAEIDAQLEELRKRSENSEAQGEQERSKDIPVPPAVQAQVDELLENSKHIALNSLTTEEKAAINIELLDINTQLAEFNGRVILTKDEQATIDGLKARKSELLDTLKNENKYYVDSRTGERYVRTTTWMKEESNAKKREAGEEVEDDVFDETKPFYYPSTNIGNSVDEYVRDFMDGNLREPSAYPHISKEIQDSLHAELMKLEAQFKANGEKVIAKDVVLFNDRDITFDSSAAGVAGTVDLLTVDANGNFRIYDMKTIRNAVTKNKVKIGSTKADGSFDVKYGNNKDGKGLQDKHLLQLSAYRLMLMNQLGAEVPFVGIIPVSVAYANPFPLSNEERKAITADSATYLGGVIAHTPLSELHGMTEPEAAHGEPDSDEDLTPTDEQRIAELETELNEVTAELDELTQRLQKPLASSNVRKLMARKQEILDELTALTGEDYSGGTDPDVTPTPIEELRTLERSIRKEVLAAVDEAAKYEEEENAAYANESKELEKDNPDFRLVDAFRKQQEDARAKVNAAESKQEAAEDKLEALLGTDNFMKTVDDFYNEDGTRKDAEPTPEDTPTVDFELEAGTVVVGLEMLLPYFASQLSVVADAHHGLPYLVHGHEGALVMGEADNTADQFELLQSILSGNNTQPVTFRIESDQELVSETSLFTKYKHADSILVNEASFGKNKTYRDGGKGDSLKVAIYVGDQRLGTMPTTSELLQAAQDRGQANLRNRRIAAFGSTSRLGAPALTENTMMTEIGQQQHLENAVAMHALRTQLFELNKQAKEAGVTPNIRVELSFGETGFGETAQGGLIFDTSKSLTPEQTGADKGIRKNGVALMMPNAGGKTMSLQMSGDPDSIGRSPNPYQFLEKREGATQGQLDWWESGALFIPLEQNGQVLWVKAPGMTISEMNNSDQIVSDLIKELQLPDGASASRAQNLLGSRAVVEVEPGVWGLFPSNISGGVSSLDSALSVYREGQGWSTPLEDVVPGMKFDIAAQTAEGTSAFHSGERFFVGDSSYESLADFVAKEIKLGYAPVTRASGQHMSWTHPLAPAYPYNDGTPGSDFSNENTKATQLRVMATVMTGPASTVKPVVKVSGKALTDALVQNDPKVKTEGDGSVDTSWMVDDEAGDLTRWMDTATAESSNNGDKATDIDMETASEWWAANMSSVPFKRVKGMIERNGRVGYGIFEKGAVLVSDQAVVGTEYHEAFHSVFHMFLSDGRQAKVMADARRMYGEGLTEEQLEENLAEDFREYMLSSGLSMREKSVVRRFFAELLELINVLRKDGFKGARKMMLFQGINRGKFNNKDARVREFATRNKLIMAEIPEYDEAVQKELTENMKNGMFLGYRAAQQGKGGPVLQKHYEEIKRISALTGKEFSEEVAGGLTKQDAINFHMVEIGFHMMKHMAQGVVKTAPNRDELIKKYASLFNTNGEVVKTALRNTRAVTKLATDLTSKEFTAGTDTSEQYNDDFEKMNPKDSLSANVKAIIETTPKVSIKLSQNNPVVNELLAKARMAVQEGNSALAQEHIENIQNLVNTDATERYFGLPEMMDINMVFPFLSDRLADKQSPKEMFETLYELGNVYPEFKLLAIRLMKEEADVQAQFFAGFKRGSTAELVVDGGYVNRVAPFEGTLANNNRVPIQLRIQELAARAKVTDSKFASQMADRVQSAYEVNVGEMTSEDFATAASKMLDAIGFSTMDPVARERVLALKADDVDFRRAVFAGIRQTMSAYSRLAGVDVNNTEQVSQAERGFNRALMVLSKQFDTYDMGAVSTTFNNVKGSRIFSKQVPSFTTEWFDQFANLKGDITMQEKQIRETIFRDPRMFATVYGRILFPQGHKGNLSPEGLKAMQTYRLGGMATGDGATYTEMNEVDWMEFLITSTMQRVNTPTGNFHFLPITTPSDGTNTMMVPAEVFHMNTEVGANRARKAIEMQIRAEVFELQRRDGRFTNEAVNEVMMKHLNLHRKGDVFRVIQNAPTQEAINEAVDAAMNHLSKEAETLAQTEAFINGLSKTRSSKADPRQVAHSLVVSGYISNWSTGVALAGTPNEFKSELHKTTVDMQKRHKHIVSPGVANAGVTNRTHFRSVTMTESTLDLSLRNAALKAWPDYSAVDVADAQSYVSIEFYEDILKEHGDWNPEIGAAIAKAKKGEPLSKGEVKLLRPYKPFYYARVFNEETGMYESQQIKNSIIPVIKGISPEFDKFAAWMANPKNNIDQVQMESAHKVGKTRETVDLRNADGTFNAVELKAEQVYTLPMKGYRKQVNVTDHWHNDSTNKLASQLEKIVTASAVRLMGERGDAINAEFLQTMDEIYMEQRNEFFRQFDNEGDRQFNKTKFKEWLLNEIKNDEVPQAQIDMIEAEMFTAPGVIGLVRSRVFSAVQKNVNTIRVAGGTQVQVASQFYRDDENPLRGMREENGKVLPAEIVVSRDNLPKQYRDMDISEIPDEVLTSICLRIPSEAINSGAVVKIVGFLPEGMDGVIVPDEFVTQMGSDFDVDKLFFQFKEGDNGKKDRLFDLQVEVFTSPEVIKEVMAPQGFQTFSERAKARPMRSKAAEETIQKNPLSVTTHAAMRADNMAGVTLKGQAANKNVVLLDLIRNGWSVSYEFKLNGKKVGFESHFVSPKMVRLFAEAVAAAMDGAKDPVYGKLGITQTNFGFFSEILLLTNGDIDAALDIIQSRPAQMEAAGHIRISYDKSGPTVEALTDAGKQYLENISKGEKNPLSYHKESGHGTMPTNANLFTSEANTPKAEAFMIAAIGTWKKEISSPLNYITQVMRMDKKNVGKDIEGVIGLIAPAKKEMGHFQIPGMPKVDADGDSTQIIGQAATSLPIKREMNRMFLDVERMLEEAGDSYLSFKRMHSEDPIARGITMAHWDATRRQSAAEVHASQATYTAMGERSVSNPGALSTDRAEWSLENWLRYFRTSEEIKTNPALALVVGKLLVQPNSYNVRGTFFDNVTLVGVADDGELRMVSEAMEELYESDNDDLISFVESIDSYEAQRSRYGMSQSRMTRILPAGIQKAMAEATGAFGVSDEVLMHAPLAILKSDIWNPKARTLWQPRQTAAEVAASIGKAAVYQSADGYIIYPNDMDEDGNIMWASVESPHVGQNFSGKMLLKDAKNHSGSAENQGVDVPKFEGESRLEYHRDSSIDDKVSHLEDRFRKAGIPVKVVLDSTMSEYGKVKIENGGATITINPDTLQGDTIAHEFGHILVEALGENHPLIKQAIEELRGSELWAEVEAAYPDLSARDLGMEVLVTAIGRKGSKLFAESKKQSKFQTIYNRIMRAIGKLFGITPKATEQLAEMLMFGDNTLSLDQKIATEQYQRAITDVAEAIDHGRKQLVEHLRNLRRRGGTSTEAQEVLERAAAVERRLRSKATNNVKMAVIKDLTVDATRQAWQHTEAVRDYTAASSSNIHNAGITVEESLILDRAYNLREELNRLDAIIDGFQDVVVEGSPAGKKTLTELKQARAEMAEAYKELDSVTRRAISKKLINQSTDKVLTEADLEGVNVFDLWNYANTQHLAKDSSGIAVQTLGGAEVRNVVMQLTHKLASGIMDSANYEAKQSKIAVEQILDKAGVSMSDLMAKDGKHLITEFNVEYFEEMEAARKKGFRALMEFHADNTEQAFTSSYARDFMLTHELGLSEATTELLARMRNPQLNNATIRRMSKDMANDLADAGAVFANFHDIKVKDGFEVAMQEAKRTQEEEVARIDAAREAGEEYEKDYAAVNAWNRFQAENQVAEVNGQMIPLVGEFAQHTIKEQYTNDNYTGTETPMAKHQNAEWTATTQTAREALTALKAEFEKATGSHGAEMIERGYVPVYKSHAGESTTDYLKAKAKSIRETLETVTNNKERAELSKQLNELEHAVGNEQGVDSQGNPVYTTNDGAWTWAHANEEFNGFNDMEGLKNNLSQFVVDSTKQTARRSLEAVAYLTRGYLADSKVVDSKHTFGKNQKAWKEGSASNVIKTFDAFMEGTIADNWRDKSSLDGLSDALQAYTSLMGVGLNPSAWVNNFGYGAVQNRLVNLGEGVYTKESLKAANKLLRENATGIFTDISKSQRTMTNKTIAIIHTFDIAEDQRELPFNRRETRLDKAINAAFIGQTFGETMLQNSVMLAMMMDTEVILADGEVTNLYDALVHDPATGTITFPEGAKIKSGARHIELNSNSMGAFTNKVRHQNQYTHGAYNKQDAGIAQRQWYGRLAMQFRRWLPMGMKTRFTKRGYNEAREREEIGTYTALVQVLLSAAQDVSNLKKLFTKLENMSEEDQFVYRHAKRAATEVGLGIALLAGLSLLAAMGGGDDDSWLESFAKSRGERLGMELLTYTPLGLLDMKNQLGKDPMAGGARIENIVELGYYGITDVGRFAFTGDVARYQGGMNRDKSKTGVKFRKSLPVIDHWNRLRDIPSNYLAYSKTQEIFGSN